MTTKSGQPLKKKTHEEYDFDGTIFVKKTLAYAPIWHILEDVVWHNQTYKAGWYFIDECQQIYEERFESFTEASIEMNEYAKRELGV